MARTVAGRREDASELTARPAYPDRTKGCSFCIERTPAGVRHDLCMQETHSSSPGRKDNKTWTCQCWKEGHPDA